MRYIDQDGRRSGRLWVKIHSSLTKMLAVLVVGAAFIVVLLITALWLSHPRSRTLTTIPGLHPTDPKDGNVADISQAGSLHEFLCNLHEDYGPIASFWLGQQLTVSIASPELFKEQAKVFDRPSITHALYIPLLTESSITYTNGLSWRNRRAMEDRAYGHEQVAAVVPKLQKIGEDLANDWGTIARGQHVPLRQAMFAVAIKAITAVSFGGFFNDKELERLRESYVVCWTELESRLGGDMPAADSPRQKRFDEHKKAIFEQMAKALEARRAAGETGELLLIDILLASGQPQSVMLADSVTYLVSGLYTTGLMLTWALYYLASHPEIQEKVVEEMRQELGSEDVDARVINKLVYLRQVLDETLRCSVLAPYAARFQDVDTELGGHKLPARTPVIHALGVVLQDEKLYPEPSKFDPERMSPEKKSELPKYAFEPFGFAGKRKCPAYRLSYMESTVFLSILLRKFKVKLVEGQVVTPVYGLVTTPKEEVWITIEQREK